MSVSVEWTGREDEGCEFLIAGSEQLVQLVQCLLRPACGLLAHIYASYFLPEFLLGSLPHVSGNVARQRGVESGECGAGRLHDINGAHFVHFICVICQPKCVAFSLLIYRARSCEEREVWA